MAGFRSAGFTTERRQELAEHTWARNLSGELRGGARLGQDTCLECLSCMKAGMETVLHAVPVVVEATICPDWSAKAS